MKTIAKMYLAIARFLDWAFDDDGIPYTSTTLLSVFFIYCSIFRAFESPIVGNLTADFLLWFIIQPVAMAVFFVFFFAVWIGTAMLCKRIRQWAEATLTPA